MDLRTVTWGLPDSVGTAIIQQSELQQVRIGSEALVERVNLAVRDGAWGTAPVFIASSRIETDAGTQSFSASVAGWLGRLGALEYAIEMEGRAGRLRVSMEATARSSFEYRRLGLCVLLPSESYAGRPARVHTAEGWTDRILPATIGAQYFVGARPIGLTPPFTSMRVFLDMGEVEFDFGDGPMEIEDQRNWSDPSFKVYSAAHPESHLLVAHAGDQFHQVVDLRWVGGAYPTAIDSDHPGTVSVGARVGVLPRVTITSGESRGVRHLYHPTNFAELNRAGTPIGGQPAAVQVGVNGSVHAADDRSVMATTSIHGQLAGIINERFPAASLILEPMDFCADPGEWRDAAGVVVASPPQSTEDPRRSDAFGAAWVVASLDRLAKCRVDDVGYFDQSASLDGTAPFAQLIAELAEFSGRPLLEVFTPPGIRAVAVETASGAELWIAEVAGVACEVRVAGEATSLEPYAVIRTTLRS